MLPRSPARVGPGGLSGREVCYCQTPDGLDSRFQLQLARVKFSWFARRPSRTTTTVYSAPSTSALSFCARR